MIKCTGLRLIYEKYETGGGKEEEIGNAVVDFAAQFGFGWFWLGFKLGLGCSLID